MGLLEQGEDRMILHYCLLNDGIGHKGIAPTKATEGSVCYDLALPQEIYIYPGEIKCVPLLISFDITEGYYIEVFPRSSLQTKYGVISSTSIIDTDYKLGIHAIMYNTREKNVHFNKGDRVLQFIVKEKQWVELYEIQSIKNITVRGGLGSTGD